MRVNKTVSQGMGYLLTTILVGYLVPAVILSWCISLAFGNCHLLDETSILLYCIDNSINHLGLACTRNGFEVLSEVESDQDAKTAIGHVLGPVLATATDLDGRQA